MTAAQDDSGLLPAAVGRLREWGGDALVREMSVIFFEDAPTLLEAACDGIANDDPVVVARTMHALKSSAGQMGAVQVQRLCERAEQNILVGDVGATAPLIGEISAAVDRFHTLLAAAVAAMPAD